MYEIRGSEVDFYIRNMLTGKDYKYTAIYKSIYGEAILFHSNITCKSWAITIYFISLALVQRTVLSVWNH